MLRRYNIRSTKDVIGIVIVHETWTQRANESLLDRYSHLRMLLPRPPAMSLNRCLVPVHYELPVVCGYDIAFLLRRKGGRAESSRGIRSLPGRRDNTHPRPTHLLKQRHSSRKRNSVLVTHPPCICSFSCRK